jgi:SPP1 family predicted phage head-tail adaptor
MTPLDIGKFNRRVTIQKKVTGTDDWGQPSEDWEDVATVWAWIKAPTGMGTINSEYMSDAGEVSSTKYSIRIRWREDVTAKMRVLCAGRTFDIRSVIYDMVDRKFVDLIVAEGINNGG